MSIHPTAIVAESAIVGDGTSIGAYTVIGEHVRIGKNCRIGSHVVVEGHTTLGDENKIYQFASVGAEPQDLKFRGEASTLTVGNKNIIREYVTLQPGTEGGGMKTVIGDGNLFMASSHVGHDSIVGNGNILANSVALSGHVEVGNYVILGGMTGIHQFCKLGDFSFTGAGSMVAQDLPPYCMAQGDRAELIGLNLVGLKRHGFSADDVKELKALYRELFRGKGTMKDRVMMARDNYAQSQKALALVDFVASSERGTVLPRKKSSSASEDMS